MPAVPIPVRASVRDLLSDLLATPVTIREGDPQELDPERAAYCSVYCRDDGEPVAALITDLTAAASLGAALGSTSLSEAQEAVAGGDALSGDLLDAFGEVANVFARLLNSPTTKHVALGGTHRVPGEVEQRVASLVLEPRARVDYAVAVDGQSTGVLTLVSS